MNYRKVQNFVIALFLLGSFAFTILYIVIGWLSYLDRNLTKLHVVVVDEPKFHVSGLDNPSFYSFSCEQFRCDFRISNESLDVVHDNVEIREQIRNIKFRDTIDLFIQSSESGRLQKQKIVHVIGLSKNNRTIIDPLKVFERDKQGVKSTVFLLSLCVIVATVWMIRRYFRTKKQRASGSLLQEERNERSV